MIKYGLVGIATFFVGVTSMFAYTPDAVLQDKLVKAESLFETMILERGDTYRTMILSALSMFEKKYSSNERAQYIAGYLIDALTPATSDGYADTYLGEYSIDDDTYGTLMQVTIQDDQREIHSNALPNHEVGEFPNPGNPNTISAQDRSRTLPLDGEYVGDAVWAREMGVAINGVKFEPETNERVECETGETYRVEAFQDVVPMGTDHNHAHVQPTGEYHYHGVPTGLIDQLEGEDIVHVGFAQDGHKIVYSKGGTYAPSFALVDELRAGENCTYRGDDMDITNTAPDGTYVSDREYVPGLGDLDECNGTQIDGEYVYILTDQYPYVGRCLQGESTQSGPGGGGRGGGTGGPPPGGAGGPPPRQ